MFNLSDLFKPKKETILYKHPAGSFYKPFMFMASRPHLLIAGCTGSGKSVALNGIIHSLLITTTPATCRFVLIDPKKVELAQYRNVPHVARYASSRSEMIDALTWAVSETDRRFSIMQRKGIREYSGAHLYVIIDELADLMTTSRKETLPLLQRLAQIGRAARVHVIACSQNILATTIPTTLKCNFSTILGLRTANRQQSRFLVSASGCEELPDPSCGVGYGYLRDGANLAKIRIHKYSDDETASIIRWWTSSACIAKTC